MTFVHGPEPQKNDSQYINLQPIQLNGEDPLQKTIGRLEFLAGWRMSSENSSFGGFSAMLTMPNDRFFFLSDMGGLTGFTLNEDTNKAERPFIAPLPDGPKEKNEFAPKNWDAESLLHDSETGQFWIGFEHQHSIWRYGRSFARKESAAAIPAMQDWPTNGGAEALLKLKDDRFLIFSESAPAKDGGYQALIVEGDPAEADASISAFSHTPPNGYRITDAAILPDGKALLLHRRFTPFEGVSAILSIADLAGVSPGQNLQSKPIATLKPPLRVDNMEALAVTQEGKKTIIWMASDDNFNAFQETLLVKFRLLKGKEKRDKKPMKADESDDGKEKAGQKPGFSSLED
ncbi:MAG: esterase-like activity of phytase family protein [Parasphingorhabdus sp.]